MKAKVKKANLPNESLLVTDYHNYIQAGRYEKITERRFCATKAESP